MGTSVIDKRALLARINRRLQKRGEQMFRTRGARSGWFVVSLSEGSVVSSRLDLETHARRLGAIAEGERLEEGVPL
jgi:hypothetical protein